MRVRSVGFLLLASLSVTPAQGQDFLACVDPDVKQALLFQGMASNISISRAMPESFRSLTPPAAFEFVGSSVSDHQTIIGYKTAMGTDTAMGAALESLESAGWSLFRNAGMQRGGFVNDMQPAYAMVCREDEMMTVTARQSEAVAYVNLSLVNAGGNFNCGGIGQAQAGTMAVQAGAMAMGPGPAQYLPRLTLPEGAQNTQSGFGMGLMAGASMSGRTTGTSIQIDTALTAQQLNDHFSQELEDQGWSHDSGWLGLASQGSTWTARPDDEIRLTGILEIVSLDGQEYLASFRATQVN